jgi:hypothetical protein
VLKFTHVASEYEDNGWYTDRFYSAMGEDFDYNNLYNELGEIRFLAHLHHAMLHNTILISTTLVCSRRSVSSDWITSARF